MDDTMILIEFLYLCCRNAVTAMNSRDKEERKSSQGNQEDVDDQVILDFYNLATGRLLTGLEVS